MHPRNIHNKPYDFNALSATHPELTPYLIPSQRNQLSINFSDPQAIFHLNKALLKCHYKLKDWILPKGYLCPPIPGRADYIHHIADLVREDSNKYINGLDIGVGANCIYPILAQAIYGWTMVGSDINQQAVKAAKKNVALNPKLKPTIEIRHQLDRGNIFKGIINEGEYYDFTLCNPPFHSSEKEATKGTLRKHKNLKLVGEITLNFGGQSNELWCNGGEALFIKRMIKESLLYAEQVRWFTVLVAKKEHLQKLQKQLDKIQAKHKIIAMKQGAKKSRILAWRFN